MEIHNTNIPADEKPPEFDIKPKPAEEYEVRVCIFDTLDMICADAEGTSDAYVRAFFDTSEDVKETDTHFRCQNGKASWNYRMVFRTKYPRKDYNLTLQLYDRDFFKSNDIIGESQLNLTAAFEDASLTKRQLNINKFYFENYMKKQYNYNYKFKDDSTFYIPMKGNDEKTGKLVDNALLRVQVDIVPISVADQNKVGPAR